jgi:hypothetical protein
MKKDSTIYIGLTMAGAVSAGAYTAGVIDFLIETLDEWERRKKEGIENTPKHNIEIPAIGGASAGGMTSIIMASLLNDDFKPIKKAPLDILQEIKENKLYHSWVDLTAENMFSEMLKTNDIENNVHSLFNSKFIDEVARRMVETIDVKQKERNYFSKKIKLFVTLSNLKGFKYNLGFKAHDQVQNKYFVERHNDYACFVLGQKEYKKDGWIPLSFKDKKNSDLAMNAAMATGAFPMGLKSRSISRNTNYILDNDWLKIDEAKPDIKENEERLDLIVDGGMINNEPFDKVNILLKEKLIEEKIIKKDEQAPNSYENFRSTVLMIDPFPATEIKFTNEQDLFSIAGKTLGAMLGQVRTKPDDVINTFQSDNSAQFMIAPTRRFPAYNFESTIKKQGSKAIACGFLGGFGGFLNKEFRIHDFFLGRANCEHFLRNHFTVPESAKNPVIEYGYKDIDKSLFYSATDKNKGLPIIPVFEIKKDKPYLPEFSCSSDWPKQSYPQLERQFKSKLKFRAQKVINNMGFGKSGFERSMIGFANRFFLRKKAAKAFLKVIKNEMNDHSLLG